MEILIIVGLMIGVPATLIVIRKRRRSMYSMYSGGFYKH